MRGGIDNSITNRENKTMNGVIGKTRHHPHTVCVLTSQISTPSISIPLPPPSKQVSLRSSFVFPPPEKQTNTYHRIRARKNWQWNINNQKLQENISGHHARVHQSLGGNSIDRHPPIANHLTRMKQEEDDDQVEENRQEKVTNKKTNKCK